MSRFNKWIEDLIFLATYEVIAYRYKVCMDKYNEKQDSYIQNNKLNKLDNYIRVLEMNTHTYAYTHIHICTHTK